PRVGAELAGVVVAVPRPLEPILWDEVPLLARDLARLAADAYRRVREEPDARLGVLAVGGGHRRARSRRRATNRGRRGPRGRRPGPMSHVNAFTSWMWTFGSSAMWERSFAASPVVRPRRPRWYGSPTWWRTSPSTLTGRMRSVTITRASIDDRAVVTVAQPPCSRPRSRARSGCTSTNICG